MPDIAQDPLPTSYPARSIRHCYINIPPDRPLTEADVRYIWQNHTVNEAGEYLGPREGGADFSQTYASIANREVSPGHGLPTLTVAMISAYVKQLGYELLPEFENKTGAFAPQPAPEPEPAPDPIVPAAPQPYEPS